MLFSSQRNKLLSVLEDLKFYDLIDPGGGDISIRCDDKSIMTTPTGSAFRRWHVNDEDLVVLDLYGNVIAIAGKVFLYYKKT